jgi:hypothetical protein
MSDIKYGLGNLMEVFVFFAVFIFSSRGKAQLPNLIFQDLSIDVSSKFIDCTGISAHLRCRDIGSH